MTTHSFPQLGRTLCPAQHAAPGGGSHTHRRTLRAGRITPVQCVPHSIPYPAGGEIPTRLAVSAQPDAVWTMSVRLSDAIGLSAGVCWQGVTPDAGDDDGATDRADAWGANRGSRSSSPKEGLPKTFCRKEAEMGLRGPRPYLTDVVMDEAEEADEAVDRLVAVIAAGLADGRLSRDELGAIRAAGQRASREVREVVQAAEAVAIAQRLADNAMRGELAESTRRRGHDAGLTVPEWSVVEPRDAA